MKPAHVTITYCVYTPNYQPGMPYVTHVKNFTAAMRKARKYGAGAEIDRHFDKQNKRGGRSFCKPRDTWIYQGAHP